MDLSRILVGSLVVVWIAMESFVNVRSRLLRHNSPATINRRDRGSGALIVVGTYLLILFAYFLTVNHVGTMPGWVSYLGNLVMAMGIVVRYGAIMQLGRYFSPTVKTASDQVVIQSGWYRVIRHPAYAGIWLIAVGLGLGLDSWVGAVMLAIGLLGMLGYRIRVEEAALLDHLGADYAEYCRRTWRMFPWVW
ncbi:MAG: isoprenylcysteine carboxylmethyltransferase family protein [Thermaerobacter sp.]|nr:isoprenylcysteine carboxylmethyltransferase family protein [Thermaerobacter sp.]